MKSNSPPMTITVKPPRDPRDEPPVEIEHVDAELIRRIRDRIGMIEAVRITRWLTKAGLITCKTFVENL